MVSLLGTEGGNDKIQARVGVAARPQRERVEWYLGGQLHLSAKNEDGDLNQAMRTFCEPSISFCLFFVQGEKCVPSAANVICSVVVVVRV